MAGAIPTGLPTPVWPRVQASDVSSLILPAVGIMIVAFSDVVLTGRAFAARAGQTIDADQELRALGATNIVAGLFRGFPVSGSSPPTTSSKVVMRQAGLRVGRTVAGASE